MIKIAAGMILGVLIGAACRWFDVPVPTPPRLVGALLVVAMTVGYLAVDKLIPMSGGLASKPAQAIVVHRPVANAALSGSLRDSGLRKEINVMKALKFSQFRRPSVLHIEEVTD
jgi:XapX domain-containing protein